MHTWISLTYNVPRKETWSPPSKVWRTALSMLTVGRQIHRLCTTSTPHGWCNLNRPPKYPPLRHTTCKLFWSVKPACLWRWVPFVTSLPFFLPGAIKKKAFTFSSSDYLQCFFKWILLFALRDVSHWIMLTHTQNNPTVDLKFKTFWSRIFSVLKWRKKQIIYNSWLSYFFLHS